MTAVDPCADCGAALAPGARFCHMCGRPAHGAGAGGRPEAADMLDAVSRPRQVLLAGEGERRFVTCLFADLSDYSAICSAFDAERVQALLQDFFGVGDRLVAQAGGRVIDHAGDAIVAVFGAPVAFGDDALRAVRVAQSLHDAVAALEDPRGGALRVHVGCASGEVIATTMAIGEGAKYTVTGDAVNLAARLAGVARAGETVISDECHRAASPAVLGARLDDLRLRGVDGVRTGWRVERLSETAPSRVTLVGRAAELRAFHRVITACRAQGRGCVVRVEGEAGIGKSRLLAEVAERARTAGFEVHAIGFVDFGAGARHAALGGLLRSLLPAGLRDEPARGLEWVRDRLAQDGSPATAPQALVEDSALAAELGAPLSDAQRNALGSLSYRHRGDALLRSLATLLRRLAAEQPRLVIVEDVHWAPGYVTEFLSRLAVEAAGGRCVFVFASRESAATAPSAVRGDPAASAPSLVPGESAVLQDPSTRARDVDARDESLVLRLAPLSPDEAQRLAAALAPGDPRVAACLARAGGHPLFLESLLRETLAGGGREIPGTVHSAVSARVDRLDPTPRNVLLAASVFGVAFDLPALQGLLAADQPAQPLEPMLEMLCEVRLLQRETDGFDFAHALVRDAVYASLLSSRRRELHRRAAALFAGRQPEARAEHLLRAGDPQAGQAFLDAASAAMREQRPEAAAALATRGLESRPPPQVRMRLAIAQGDALREAGRPREAGQVLRDALARDADAGPLDEARLALVEVHRVVGEYAQAHALLDDAERGARERDEAALLARILNLRGSLMFAQGRPREGLVAHDAALREARAAGDAEGVVHALSGLGDAHYSAGELATASECFERALALARDGGMLRHALLAGAMLGRCRANALRLDEARDLAQAARLQAAQAGMLHAELVACAMLGTILDMRGEIDEMDAVAERGLALARSLGARRFEVVLLRSCAAAARARGDRVRELSLVREALRLSRATAIEFMGPNLLAVLAGAVSDAAEREAALAEGEAILARADTANQQFGFRREAIEACLLAGDWQRARHHADCLEARFSETPIPFAEIVVRRARVLCRIGERGEAGIDAEDARALARLRAEIEACGYLGLLDRAMARLAE